VLVQLGPSLEERIGSVKERIMAACIRADRRPESVTVVAVSKMVGRDDIDRAYATGLRHFGENRVQEARTKFAQRLPAGAVLHMIGYLQSNKVKIAFGLFDVIHSVDRPSLIWELSRHAEKSERVVQLLIEVNVAGEKQKAGCAPDEVDRLVHLANSCPGLHVRGFMTMAPLVTNPEDVRPIFRRLKALADSIEYSTGKSLPLLSMGMTNDFEVAIEEGATLVRIGRAIFGE
jgi:PLP dependent protein